MKKLALFKYFSIANLNQNVLNIKISLISDKINMEYIIGAEENTLQLAWQNMQQIDISDYICEVIN